MCTDGDGLERHFSTELPDVETIGLMIFDPVWAASLHLSHHCEMLHVVSGSMTLVTSEQRVHAGPGKTLLVPPQTLHRDDFDINEGLKVFYCSFKWGPAAEFFEILNAAPRRESTAVREAQFSAIFDQLRIEPAGSGELDRLVTRSRILTVPLMLLREAVAEDEAEDPSFGEQRARGLMLDAKAYVQEHFASPISLDEIAAALNVSSYHLSHVFSRESEFSLFAYLTTVRMDRAAGLLLEGELNVSQVARAVGYQNPNYFSKAFRKHFGCSPREFVATAATHPEDRNR